MGRCKILACIDGVAFTGMYERDRVWERSMHGGQMFTILGKAGHWRSFHILCPDFNRRSRSCFS